jgi:hypothetical protein
MSADALTPAQIQQQIADELALFGDWSERYQYLIDLAKTLPPYPPEFKDEAHLLKGCQSQVFVHVDPRPDLLQIHAVSDSSIVSAQCNAPRCRFHGRHRAQQELVDDAQEWLESPVAARASRGRCAPVAHERYALRAAQSTAS